MLLIIDKWNFELGNEKFRFLLVIILALVYISVSFYTLVKSPVVCCSVVNYGNIPHHRFHLNLLFHQVFSSKTLSGFGACWSREEKLCRIFFSR